MNKATEWYRKIFHTVKWVVNDDLEVGYVMENKFVPIPVMKKRMILPESRFLSNPDWTKYIAFHPLSESVAETESPVHEKLRGFLTLRIIEVFGELAEQLMILGANTAVHDKLTAKQVEMLKLIKDANKAMLGKMNRILNAANGRNKKLTMYVKRSGKIGNEDFHRVCVVRFPILDDMDDKERTICGIKCTKNEYAQIPALFNLLLPSINDGAFNAGSNSQYAPALLSMLECFNKVATHLNKMAYTFRKYLPDYEGTRIDLEYMKELEEGHSTVKLMAALIPSMEGNKGTEIREEDVDSAAAPSIKNDAMLALQDNVPESTPVSPSPAQPTSTVSHPANGNAPTWEMPAPSSSPSPAPATTSDADNPFLAGVDKMRPAMNTMYNNNNMGMGMPMTMTPQRGNAAMLRESRMMQSGQPSQLNYNQPTQQNNSPWSWCQ